MISTCDILLTLGAPLLISSGLLRQHGRLCSPPFFPLALSAPPPSGSPRSRILFQPVPVNLLLERGPRPWLGLCGSLWLKKASASTGCRLLGPRPPVLWVSLCGLCCLGVRHSQRLTRSRSRLWAGVPSKLQASCPPSRDTTMGCPSQRALACSP